jgi:hypothetical protein
MAGTGGLTNRKPRLRQNQRRRHSHRRARQARRLAAIQANISIIPFLKDFNSTNWQRCGRRTRFGGPDAVPGAQSTAPKRGLRTLLPSAQARVSGQKNASTAIS